MAAEFQSFYSLPHLSTPTHLPKQTALASFYSASNLYARASVQCQWQSEDWNQHGTRQSTAAYIGGRVLRSSVQEGVEEGKNQYAATLAQTPPPHPTDRCSIHTNPCGTQPHLIHRLAHRRCATVSIFYMSIKLPSRSWLKENVSVDQTRNNISR